MRAETRHQLKQDRFSRATIGAAEATVHWSVEHKSKLIIGSLTAAVVLAAVLGGWYYLNQQDMKASEVLSRAVRTMDTPLRPEGAPPEPDFPSFASAKDRATEAHKQFQTIVDKYPHTRTSEFARYFLGITSSRLGDNTAAERDLKEVASARNDDLSSLAKLGLAAVYSDTNRIKQAIEIYNQLIVKPTRSVGKVAAQLQLADAYQSNQQPAEAKRIYEQIQKENPATEAAQLATQKLKELK